jgi:hypothetical protein
MSAIWRGCILAALNADFFHDAHDFARITFCGIGLSGARLSEGNVTRAMRECPACARAAAGHTGHTADDCPLTATPTHLECCGTLVPYPAAGYNTFCSGCGTEFPVRAPC